MTETQSLTPDAVVSLREITEDTVYSIIKLSETLSDDQQKMVALKASTRSWIRTD